MPRPEKICKAQIVCEETPADRYHCQTKLLEGYNCFCPYGKKDIKVMDEFGNRQYRLKVQKNPRPMADGVCMDFEILPKVKNDLIEKIVIELNKTG